MSPDQPRIVIDTGVLISRVLRPDSVPAEAVRIAQSRATLLFSEDTLAELLAVLARPKFAPYVDPGDVKEYVQALSAAARIVTVGASITACRDPDDDKFLSLAIVGEADAIISGDADLQVLSPFHGIPIISPREYLDGHAVESRQEGM